MTVAPATDHPGSHAPTFDRVEDERAHRKQRLAAALRPDASIVMLGDADQLPSIAAGAVFRDLVAAVSNPNDSRTPGDRICTRLTQSYRMNPGEAAG